MPNRESSSIPDPKSETIQVKSSSPSVTKPQENKEKKDIIKEVKYFVKLEVKEYLPRFTETLGVFVALFTFVSIEIQLFSNLTSLKNAIIFTFLIFFCMVGFLFFLHFIIVSIDLEDNGWKQIVIPLIALIVLIISAFFTINLIKEDIPLDKQKYEDIETLKEKITRNELKIENLERTINSNY